MRSMFVYHADDEVVHDLIDGILFSVPPGEPFEFTNPFFGKKFMQHKWFHGVVEVELERTKAGWIFKLEEAHEKAVKALKEADDNYNQAYIETQHQDRLLQGRPAMPPSVRQKKILGRQHVNLEDFGIRPIGAKSSQEMMLEQMVQQNQLMMNLIAALVSGKAITPAEVAGLGRVVPSKEPPPEERYDGKRAPVVAPPRNVVVPHIDERPDPVKIAPKLYEEGAEPVVEDALARPEFQGDVDDPNQVPGSSRAPRSSKGAIDLNRETVAGLPIADILQGDEDRVRLAVPPPPPVATESEMATTTTGSGGGKKPKIKVMI